ncbi:MAG: winged helix-turn-helix domain-containing protein [Acidobacteriota bacterium]
MRDTTTSFHFDGWRALPDRNRLIAPSGDRVDLPAQVMCLLVELAHSEGRVLSRRELLDSVWQGRAVTDDVLTVAVHTLRKALGDRPESARYVETIKGSGYRWCVPVTSTPQATTAEPAMQPVFEAEPKVSSQLGRRWLWALPAALIALVLLNFVVSIDAPSSSAREAPSRPIVAVLPIVPFSPAADDTAFAEALSAALIDALAATGKVDVISRTTMRRYRDSPLSTAAIAGQLEVTAMLEVTIVRRLDIFQASVSLIDAETERRVWVERFAASINKMPDFAETIAAAVAGRLSGDTASLEDRFQSPGDAWVPKAARAAWVEAELAMKEVSPAAFVAAEEALSKALALAPGFAPVYAARANFRLRQLTIAAPAQRPLLVTQARQDVEEALALDPGFGPAWAARASLRLDFDWDLEGAEADLRLAFQNSSEGSEPHALYRRLLSARGRHRAAEAHARMAARLDPFNVGRLFDLAAALMLDGRLDEALEVADSVAEPRPPTARLLRAGLLDLLGQEDQAFETYLRFFADIGQKVDEEHLRAVFAGQGLTGFYAQWHEDQRESLDGFLRAAIEVRAGHAELALSSLAELLENRNPALLTLAYEPAFTPIRNDPRFLEMVAEIRRLSSGA